MDIPDVKATGYIYLYFPTLSWRFWENHPLSIASSVYERTESDMDEKVLPNSPIFELLESDSNSDAESDLRESRKLNDLLKHKHDKGDKRTLDVPETPLLPETPHSSIGLLANSDPDHAGEGYSLE